VLQLSILQRLLASLGYSYGSEYVFAVATLASRPANAGTSEWLVVYLELILGHKRLLVVHSNQHNDGGPQFVGFTGVQRSPLTGAEHLSAVRNISMVEIPFRAFRIPFSVYLHSIKVHMPQWIMGSPSHIPNTFPPATGVVVLLALYLTLASALPSASVQFDPPTKL
jgi:hypothetical protein